MQKTKYSVQQPCEYCGVVFVNERRDKVRRFCSKRCSAFARPPESRLGKPRIGRDATCEECGQTFYLAAWIERKRNIRHCSLACKRAAGEHARRVGSSGHEYARVGISAEEAACYPTAHTNGPNKWWMLRSHREWNRAHPDDMVQPGESVHHIDGFKWNDDPANLRKTSFSGHRMIHANVNRRLLKAEAALDEYRRRFGALA